MDHSRITSLLWSIADLIRDTFKRGKYQDVILPLTVLRRIDQVLEPTRQNVLDTYTKFKGKLDNPDNLLRKASGYAFYNTSLYTFERLVDDPANIAHNLRNYIQSFSPNMREVIEKFDFDNTITKLDDAGLLFQVMEKFAQVDLHPDRVSNPMMGTIFEELIRKFNEALNENPGEHLTPRDVVHLMVRLLVEGEDEKLGREHPIVTVHDPCCGTGGMLTITKDVIQGSAKTEGINPAADVHLFGQEVNPETFAICKAGLFMKGDGSDADNILYGSTLSDDRHVGRSFDYMIADPPYGKDWKRDKSAVENEAGRGAAGRFEAGTPRISDGQLLFLQHMVHHLKSPVEGGSRIAIIMNGSPLFTGDAGSGESEIRRWILENDWLDALIALPEQLFYNTGIATYVWVLSNRKPPERQGRVQLIDATDLWVPMRKSLGDKRREISDEQREMILELYRGYQKDGNRSRVVPSTQFGFRKVRIEQPLRLNFQASEERIERLDDELAFQNLAISRNGDPEKKRQEIEEGRRLQQLIREMLSGMPSTLLIDRKEFRKELKRAMKSAELTLAAPLRKAIESALSEQDEHAAACLDKKGQPEADRDLRDYQNLPLNADVAEYFEREVKSYAPDAWVDKSYSDARDGQVGRVGYEINRLKYLSFRLERELQALRAAYEPCTLLPLSQVASVRRPMAKGIKNGRRSAASSIHLPAIEVTPDPTRISREFLKLFLETEPGRRLLETLRDRNSLMPASPRDFEQMLVPVPTHKEQEDIVATHGEIKELSLLFSKIETQLAANPQNLETVRSEILRLKGALTELSDADVVRDLIRRGESKHLEFKQTFGYDVRTDAPAKYLEEACLKTVVAFLNSDGGTLLVGVSDDGRVAGLDYEIKKYHKGSADEFLLSVKNKIKSRIGEPFYPLINHGILKVGEAIIFRVDCEPSNRPVFLDDEIFYVRTNPATDKLTGRKQAEYIANRFSGGPLNNRSIPYQ